MHLPLALLAASAYPLSALARPSSVLTSRENPNAPCGPSSKFYDATPEKWAAANTDEWLNNWWTKHQSEVESMGFAKAFTRAALGSDDLTCQLSGRTGNCVENIDTCGNPKFATLTPSDMEPAYYVLNSLERLHGYINGYQKTIETAAVVTSFEKDYNTGLFYLDPTEIDPTSIKEMINALVTILSIAAGGIAVAKGASAAVGGFVGAGATMAGGAQTEAFLRLKVKAPDVFKANANSGHALGKALKETFVSLFNLNDKLMNGEEIKGEGEGAHNSGDLRQFLKGGRWVNTPDLSRANGLAIMTGVLQSIQINALWRQQPVYIMGGIPCDSTDLGATPKDQEGRTGWCDNDNKAWYFYFYQSKGGTDGSWLSRPWGSDRLGKESLLEEQYGDASEFEMVEVADVIRSSMTSWKVAGNNYTSTTFSNRMADIMNDGNYPLTEQSSLEGLWTIPVCDVSRARESDEITFKKEILPAYGYESEPSWCGPICGNDQATTDEFFEKALLTDTTHYLYKRKCGYTNWPGKND